MDRALADSRKETERGRRVQDRGASR